jgi:hypothetical protein
MVENTSLMNSNNSAAKKEFKENSLRLITHKKMGLQRERIE